MNVIQQEPQFPKYEGINYEEMSNFYVGAMKVGGKGVVETLQERDAEHIKENVETVQKVTGVIYGGQQAALRLERDERGISYPTLSTKEFEREYEKETVQKQIEEEKKVEAELKTQKEEKKDNSLSDRVDEQTGDAARTFKRFRSKQAEEYYGNATMLKGDLKEPIQMAFKEVRAVSDDHEKIVDSARGIVKGRENYQKLERSLERETQVSQQIERDNGFSR